MHLKGKYLIIVGGPCGTRRTEIAHLLAGGAAYLSTVTEQSGDDDQAKPAYHTKVVVISPLDCFDLGKGKWEYDHSQLPSANEDAARRCELAMNRGVSIIILDDTFLEKWEINPYTALAKTYEYEVISMAMTDRRMDVMSTRREVGKRSLPDRVAAASGGMNMSRDRPWTLTENQGSFVNPETKGGRLIIPDTGEPVQLTKEASDAQEEQEECTFTIDGIHDRSQNGLMRAWKFVQNVKKCKITEARSVINLALLAEDNPKTDSHLAPKATVAYHSDYIETRAEECGVIVTILE